MQHCVHERPRSFHSGIFFSTTQFAHAEASWEHAFLYATFWETYAWGASAFEYLRRVKKERYRKQERDFYTFLAQSPGASVLVRWQ
jgi:hypothetical protein